MSEVLSHELYYDPFAEEGQELFDPVETFNLIKQNYLDRKVQHDSSADEFVSKTEALMMDSVFIERFDAVQAIMGQLHNLCGEDHNLNQAVMKNSYLSGIDKHSENDGHDHKEDHDDDDEYEIDPKTGKRVKKKKKKFN